MVYINREYLKNMPSSIFSFENYINQHMILLISHAKGIEMVVVAIMVLINCFALLTVLTNRKKGLNLSRT